MKKIVNKLENKGEFIKAQNIRELFGSTSYKSSEKNPNHIKKSVQEISKGIHKIGNIFIKDVTKNCRNLNYDEIQKIKEKVALAMDKIITRAFDLAASNI